MCFAPGLKPRHLCPPNDTGARHAGKNGFCTQIGNDWFTLVRHAAIKEFAELSSICFRAGHTDYVLNDAAYGYMLCHDLSAPAIALLMAGPAWTRFDDPAAWLAHLDRLGSNALKVTPIHPIASEGASWGYVQSHGFLCDKVVLSDDAGQFNVGRHALCWVHAERLVHKLNTFTDRHRAAQ